MPWYSPDFDHHQIVNSYKLTHKNVTHLSTRRLPVSVCAEIYETSKFENVAIDLI